MAGDQCSSHNDADYSGVTIIELSPEPALTDYTTAMRVAEEVAANKLGEFMLLSWYDRDRDFESPQHSSECHQGSAIPGYVDYGLNHGATLKIDLYQGRFIFLFLEL